MNNIRTVAAIVAAALILGLVSSAASLSLSTAQAKPNPTHVEKYMTSGKMAFANWFSEDNETITNGYVALVDSAKTAEGTPESFVDVSIQQYKLVEHCKVINGQEICNYEYADVIAFFGSAEVGKSDFKISSNVRSASLNNVKVTGYDYFSGKEMTITVDATWTDAGSPVKQRNSYSETTDNYKLFFKGMLSGRAADASIEISGDINVSNGDNPDYTDAFIAKAKNSAFYRIYEEPI